MEPVENLLNKKMSLMPVVDTMIIKHVVAHPASLDLQEFRWAEFEDALSVAVISYPSYHLFMENTIDNSSLVGMEAQTTFT